MGAGIAAFVVPYHLASLREGTGAGPDALVASGALAGVPVGEVRTIIVPPGANEVQACVRIDGALAASIAG